MKKPVRTLLLAIGASVVTVPRPVMAQAIPNEMLPPLAVSIREEIRKGPVGFGAQTICEHSLPTCDSSGGDHSPQTVVEMASLLSARVIPSDSVRLCQDGHGGCGAAALVAVSAPSMRGDSARVVARFWFDGALNGLPRSVWREVEIVLYRATAGWRVVRKGVIGAS